MGKARILIVEDDVDIGTMIKIYFQSQGYVIDHALRGSEALEKTRHGMPHLIVLDIMLPDIDGYEVCRTLRTNTRTSHIPVIFLTQKDERSDKLQGLELGADDYITKPFDIEELRLRVQNAIARSERESLTDAQSGLPSGKLIEEQLRRAIRQKGWTYMDIRINFLEPFKEVNGIIAAGDVLRFTGMLMGEVVDELGTPNDFIGHAGGDSFAILTTDAAALEIKKQIKTKFFEKVQGFYNFIDRQRGFLMAPQAGDFETESKDKTMKKTPFMSLAVGMISPSTHFFSDIREITELAAEERRKDMTAHLE